MSCCSLTAVESVALTVCEAARWRLDAGPGNIADGRNANPSNDPNQTVVVPAEERYRQISVAIPMASRPPGSFRVPGTRSLWGAGHQLV